MSEPMSEDTWHVQVEEGDVKVWTIDQLDAAFKAGLVDESTFVLESGSTQWMQLGTLLGSDEPEAPPAPVAAASVVIAPTAAAVSEMPPPLSYSPMSTAPMVSDFDDENPAAFRSSKKKPMLIGLGVALVAAGVGLFAFTRGSAVAEVPVQAAVAVPAPPPPAPAPPPPAPVADKPAADTASQSLGARFSEEQRAKLAALDKSHAEKVAAQQKARAATTTRRSGGHHSKEKNPFGSGGAQGDPLNGKL